MNSPSPHHAQAPNESESARPVPTYPWRRLPHPIRWIAVAVVGGATLLTGVVLLVLPGPGIPLIILGLLILASEFAWAERTLHQVRRRSAAALSTLTRRSTRRESSQ
ncbi:MAG: hypothetical protein F2840_03720 [Actinobacteria bacterium]|uniref:Unannotated protein n=1 Tax=freshwater metagenome TaxID=449393 RepID=A0A6J7J5S3_9ZZZZ|nr:hypothetical protein [Actinomycetota bacterium]